jgi:hypothetical protein
VVNHELLTLLPLDVCFVLSGSSKDWENLRELFPADLRVIMKYLAQQRFSKENLLSASLLSMWLVYNLIHANLMNGSEIWKNFIPILSHFVNNYIGTASIEIYNKMKNAINTFLEEERKEIEEITQPNPSGLEGDRKEIKEITQPNPSGLQGSALLSHYIEMASTLNNDFHDKLKGFDSRAVSCPKDRARAKEKADLTVNAGGYAGDYSRVLDYLRGTLFIDVDVATQAEDLKERFGEIRRDLEESFGPITRQKVFLMDRGKGPPRILLNLRYSNNPQGLELICEIQIRFSLYGFGPEFQDIMHLVYEMERKPKRVINWQPHIRELSKEIVKKTGIDLNVEGFKSFNLSHVEISYTAEDEKFNGILGGLNFALTNNKGLIGMEVTTMVKYTIEYIVDESGQSYLQVPGQSDQYQVHLLPEDIASAEMVTFLSNFKL